MTLLAAALAALMALAVGAPDGAKLDESCTFRPKNADPQAKPIPLYGRFIFVEERPDLRIALVKAKPDLRVRRVRTPVEPTACGEWRVVKTFGTRVQIVSSEPDLRVQLVDAMPGLPGDDPRR
jgi:hypothetical protein